MIVFALTSVCFSQEIQHTGPVTIRSQNHIEYGVGTMELVKPDNTVFAVTWADVSHPVPSFAEGTVLKDIAFSENRKGARFEYAVIDHEPETPTLYAYTSNGYTCTSNTCLPMGKQISLYLWADGAYRTKQEKKAAPCPTK